MNKNQYALPKITPHSVGLGIVARVADNLLVPKITPHSVGLGIDRRNA